jgi:hypothetical protein
LLRALRAGAVALALGWAVPSAAQAPEEESARQARLDALFRETLRNPADLDATFRYAEEATAQGDVEAAIGALERILFFNDQLARVHLELGILYFRLGSYALARTHLEAAIGGADVPEDVRRRVNEFLAEADRRLRTSRFEVVMRAGMRYQTNANIAPSGTTGRFFGIDFTLPPDSTRIADWNGFFQGVVRHVWDFGRQSGEYLETNIQTYYAAQIRVPRYNIGLIEIDSGPRLLLHPQLWPRTTIRPYVLAGFVALGDRPYATTVGGGSTIEGPLPLDVSGEMRIEYRRREFQDTDLNMMVSGQSGGLTLLSGTLRRGLPRDIVATLRGTVGGANARDGAYSFSLFQIDAGLSWQFDPPFLRLPARATLSAGLSYIWTNYAEPNPLYDPDIKRRDRELRLATVLDVPLTNRFGGFVQVIWSHVDSNIVNFRTSNLGISLGPTMRF